MANPSPALLNSLTWPDYVCIVVYFTLNLGIGWWVQKKKRTSGADYFLGGGRIPPWAGAVSWYGTAVSSVSFMALPAYAYAKDWLSMLVGPLGSGCGFIIADGFIGNIRRLKTPTIFAYLESRFSREVRMVVAGLAILLKIFGRASVIMVLPALAISAATGMNVYLSIVLMGIVTTIYSMEGGFEAVVWTDVLQVAVMFGGVALMVGYAAAGVIGSVAGIAATVYVQNYTSINAFFHSFLAFAATVFVGYVASLLIRRPVGQAQLTGFTIWDLPPRRTRAS